MRIVLLSDIHHHLPEIPDCDLLLIAGDLVHTRKNDFISQEIFINGKFKKWLLANARRITCAFTSGNHDFLFERYKHLIDDEVIQFYYEDVGFEFQEIKFWLTPQNLRFYDWSFNRSEAQLREYFNLIPCDTNVLVSHQPPYGAGDLTERGERVGSVSLMRKIQELNLDFACVAHIHSDRGIHQLNDTMIINAAITDEEYGLAHTPIIIDYEKGKIPRILNI